MTRLALALTLAAAASLAACDDFQLPKYEPNQVKRQQIFQACLLSVPKGPQVTRNSDWSDVVNACEAAAYRQSLVCVKNCPPLPSDRNEGRT